MSRILVTEPAVIKKEHIHTKFLRLSNKVHELIFVKIKICSLPVIQQCHPGVITLIELVIPRPIMEIATRLSCPSSERVKINSGVENVSPFLRIRLEAYGLIPDITRSSPLWSTSNVKRKLPVHPKVPTSKSPEFSLAGESIPSWKKGGTKHICTRTEFGVKLFASILKLCLRHIRFRSPVSVKLREVIIAIIEMKREDANFSSFIGFFFSIGDCSVCLYDIMFRIYNKIYIHIVGIFLVGKGNDCLFSTIRKSRSLMLGVS